MPSSERITVPTPEQFESMTWTERHDFNRRWQASMAEIPAYAQRRRGDWSVPIGPPAMCPVLGIPTLYAR